MANKFKPRRTDDLLPSHPNPAIQAPISVDPASLLPSIPTGIPYTWGALHTFSAGLSGNLTGNVTGNLTGSVTGGTVTGTVITAGAAVPGSTAKFQIGDGTTALLNALGQNIELSNATASGEVTLSSKVITQTVASIGHVNAGQYYAIFTGTSGTHHSLTGSAFNAVVNGAGSTVTTVAGGAVSGYVAAGTGTTVYGQTVLAGIVSTGSAVTVKALDIQVVDSSSGAISGDAIGLNVQDIPTVGGTAYAIKTGVGLVYVGDSLTVIGTLTGTLTGNASTATVLQTARNINGVSFNGSADITVTAAAGTLTGSTLASGVTASSLTSVGTLTGLTMDSGSSATALSVIASSFADLRVEYSGGGTDAKWWYWRASSGGFQGLLVNDAQSSSASWVTVTRSGLTPSTIAFTGAITMTGTVASGTASVTGGFSVNAPTLASGSVVDFLGVKTNSVNKWLHRIDGNETGSDVGADWNLLARDDSGAIIDRPIIITRKAAGAITMPSTRPLIAGEFRASGDIGGQASTNTLTKTSDLTTNSTGVGTIKFKGATSRDSSGFIKFYIGTTAYYAPVFSAITG